MTRDIDTNVVERSCCVVSLMEILMRQQELVSFLSP